MGHSGDDVVHKKSNKMKTHWPNRLQLVVLVYFKVLFRTRYIEINVLLVHCPYKEKYVIINMTSKSFTIVLTLLGHIKKNCTPISKSEVQFTTSKDVILRADVRLIVNNVIEGYVHYHMHGKTENIFLAFEN